MALVVLLAAPLLLWQTAHWSRFLALTAINDGSRQTLILVVENLRGELARFRSLPHLIAIDPAFKRLLKGVITAEDVQSANLSLERTNRIAGALDIYIMNRSGLTLAASNWASDRPFIGRNFSYRPYFQDAMQGRLGRYFAIGTTSRERGYYFAYPIRDGPDILGALAVKVQVGHLDRTWRGQGHEIIVTDGDGVIFLSSHPEWRFRTLTQLTEQTLSRIAAERKYAGAELLPLSIEARKTGLVPDDILRIRKVPISVSDPPDGPIQRTSLGSQARDYLTLSEEMFDAGWRVTILARTDSVGRQVTSAMLVVGFVIASVLLIAAYAVERRRRVRERIALQAQAQTMLEQRVQERTYDLEQTNVQLRTEVSERKRAERELRQAQEELVQASKLAALGEVSAGISHELNQPLAAIRSYADNARAFLDRDREDAARSNLAGISQLTERMAHIIRHLRTYARKDAVAARPTPLLAALREALSLLEHRFVEHDIAVVEDLPKDDVMVVGGDVRLQQVFVNLMTNSIDAMASGDRRVLGIAVRAEKEAVVVTLKDSGPGIGTDDPARVFDPFFTTKEVGEGLGLGLSITYGIVKQFGGAIEAANDPAGGAVFTVRLVPARSLEEETV